MINKHRYKSKYKKQKRRKKKKYQRGGGALLDSDPQLKKAVNLTKNTAKNLRQGIWDIFGYKPPPKNIWSR